MSSSHAVSGSGGGGDGVDGGSGGGGGDGGSSGGETVAKPVAGDLEDVPALGADVIVLHVGVIRLIRFASFRCEKEGDF